VAAEIGVTVDPTDIEIDLLLEAVFRRYQHDFRHYARVSVRRRLQRALVVLACPSISALQEKVLHEEGAFGQLLSLLTIRVSDLFRDPGFYASLRQSVVPVLATYPSLKVWVAGCAGGEEVYSLAILFREEGLFERTLFYATDIDPAALRSAETGIFDAARAAAFTRSYQAAGGKSSLSDHYTAAYGGIKFDRALRKNIVFSDHSLATDQVFAEVHLVTCRNVLMYFDRDLQNRAVGLFAESLVRRGFLSLGTHESLLFCAHQDRFGTVDRRYRIYQRVG
jgi:chemotaxis protein methyltransferase CheR